MNGAITMEVLAIIIAVGSVFFFHFYDKWEEKHDTYAE